MDTPERAKVTGTPLSQFEDSPIYNFINNLSPIQPVKSIDSVPIVHTHQPLNFASLSSIFSSPHANPPRETRFLTRHPFTDYFKQENFSDNVGESSLCSEVSDAGRPSGFNSSSQENCTVTCSLNEATVDPPDGCPALPSTFPRSTQYYSGSPDHNVKPCLGIKMDLKLDVGHTPVEFHFVQNGVERRKVLFAMEDGVQENLPFELNKDKGVGRDWESLIPDDGQSLLIFDSSTESEAHKGVGEKAVDNDGHSVVSLLSNCTENADHLQKTKPDISHGPCVHNVNQDLSQNCSEVFEKEHETDHATKMLSDMCHDQVDSHQQRGMRRRCLVFEVASVSKRNMYSDSKLNPLTSLSFKGKSVCDTKNLKPNIRESLYALPGIGLHLNALATTSKDRMVNKETLASEKQIISIPCSVGSLTSTTAGRNSLRKSSAVEKDLCPSGSEVDLQIVSDDAPKDATPNIFEELSQGSPKKKRRKSGNGGESEGCKRCNCKKSKCLKLYCECFAAGVYCSEPCSCQGCFNKPIHQETVLATRRQIESRNPLAFAPKVIRTSESGLEMQDDDKKTPASARHKRGCNCKKSNCLKKYCECYQGGVGCSIGCRCEGCKNIFGRKDGFLPRFEELEQAEKEANACEKENESLGDDQQNTSIQIDEHHSSGRSLPIAPYQSCRLSVELPFSSIASSTRSTKLSMGRSPALYGSHMLRKCEMVLSSPKLENNVSTVVEDDTPAILRPTASPTTTGIRIASPNQKRVSPPHGGVGLSPPSRKGCRKLILRSIPSFPPLGSDVSAEHPANYSNSSFGSSAVI
ncbi:Tesmin TSO1-like CXC domain containing protein [Musa troglodytarum]|uniref:Tesmin TSO1-like CXC domain containing protein n=1 Tax=Musa troglodytarum TaxID=320322 RepID=A0A9E7KY35_9LILI|nr:Tesmin TSO1-like CXC domain containing protein [Musa troglodytarum]